MLKVSICIEDKNEFERILAILELGLLTALENNLIDIDESEGYLFNPYTLKILKENKIDLKITDIIHQGCELEDIRSLLPGKLHDNILKLKIDSMTVLKNLKKPNLPIEKLIKKIE